MTKSEKQPRQEEVKAVRASYTPTGLDIFSNNPLIKALPNFEDDNSASIANLLARKPTPIAAQATRTTKLSWLTAFNESFFVAQSKHIELQELIDSVIRVGYISRNPTDKQEFDKLQSAYERQQRGEKKIYYRSQSAKCPITLCLLGCSGIGKSIAVDRILELYPQRIEHSQQWVGFNIDQVVYLKVECPHEGSVKSLCLQIIYELSRITANAYAEQLTTRETLNSLKEKAVNLLTVHKVGLLVIDEIQNLMSSRKNREELFNFIVSIPNTLGVPIMMVGTPKIMKFMQTDLRIARRFGSERCLVWNNMSHESIDWKRLINALWQYNILDDAPLEIPKQIEEAFYKYSQGISAVLVKLFVSCMSRAMVRQIPLTVDLIKWCFNQDLKNVVPMVRALQTNNLGELEKYEDIRVDSSIDRQAVESLKEEIAKTIKLDWQEQHKKASTRLERIATNQSGELKDLLLDVLKRAQEEGLDVKKLIDDELVAKEQIDDSEK